MNTIKSIHSELLKLKYPPIFWLSGLVVLATLAIIFSSIFIDIHKSVSLGVSPWIRLNNGIQSVFSIFMGVPFIVLFVGAAIHIEHQNQGFKQLYTLPKSRAVLLLHKLSALIAILIGVVLMLLLGNTAVGYVLNSIYPETEFTYFSLPILGMLKDHGYILLSFLGVVGVQFFLSLRFKGFLVPASIGVLAYIVALILSTTSSSAAKFFPYCYPIIAREHKMFGTSLNIDQTAVLNSVELSSIAVFIFFVLLSLYTEQKRNI